MADHRRAERGDDQDDLAPAKRRTLRSGASWLARQVGSAVVGLVLRAVQEPLRAGAVALLSAGAATYWSGLAGAVVGALVVAGGVAAFTVWWRGRSDGASSDEPPSEQPSRGRDEAMAMIEIVVSMQDRLKDAVDSGDARVGDFLRSSVLTPFADELRTYLAPDGTAAIDVETAILEVTSAHRIDVVHGIGDYARELQDEPACYGGRLPLDEILARKTEAHFPGGGYAYIPCELVPGREHYLVLATSVPFPQDKKVMLEHLAVMVESAATILARRSP